MPVKTISKAVLSFAVLLVGLGTTFFAASTAYDSSDQTSAAVETFHPVMDTALPLMGLLLILIVAFGIIGAGGYLLKATSGRGGSLR